MALHIGEQIRKRAEELGYGPTKLGKLINTTKQNVSAIYKRPSVNSELLQKFCDALKFDFFQLYHPTPTALQDGQIPYENSHMHEVVRLQGQLAESDKELEDLREINAYLKKLNAFYERQVEELNATIAELQGKKKRPGKK